MADRFSLLVYFADGPTVAAEGSYKTLAEASSEADRLIAGGGINSVAIVDRRLVLIKEGRG